MYSEVSILQQSPAHFGISHEESPLHPLTEAAHAHVHVTRYELQNWAQKHKNSCSNYTRKSTLHENE